ncbi:DNA replication licensing factor MCM2-like [Raphanus sativus]|nr:DNA replication licensing factor MCM2-like [Raphanus sativus]
MYRIQGSLREWVMRDEVRRFIAKKFQDSLLTFVKPNSENGEYVRLINEMVSANKCSLEIDYKEFIHVHPNIAIWLADAPQPVLEVMEDVSERVIFDLHPNYKNIHQNTTKKHADTKGFFPRYFVGISVFRRNIEENVPRKNLLEISFSLEMSSKICDGISRKHNSEDI